MFKVGDKVKSTMLPGGYGVVAKIVPLDDYPVKVAGESFMTAGWYMASLRPEGRLRHVGANTHVFPESHYEWLLLWPEEAPLL